MALGGKPKGVSRSYENKNKPLGAPMLRRDPSAQEKLAIIAEWLAACGKESVERIKDLRFDTMLALERRLRWPGLCPHSAHGPHHTLLARHP